MSQGVSKLKQSLFFLMILCQNVKNLKRSITTMSNPKHDDSHDDKSVKFTDHAINKYQYNFNTFKGISVAIKLENSGLKGLKLVQYKKTKKKYFTQNFWFDGKTNRWTVGEFRLGIFGVKDCKTKVVTIMDTHTNDNGLWIKSPTITSRHEKERITKAELENRKLFTVRECIERLCKANFPKIRRSGTLTGLSIMKMSLSLIGYNKRTRHLVHHDDDFGNGSISFRGCPQYNTTKPKDWDDLFAKFPAGHGCTNFINGKKTKGVSMYDHEFGKYLIEELTPSIINSFLDEIPRGWATKRAMINALQVLWANSKKYMGPNKPINPTTREILDVKKFDVSKGKNSKYNRRKYTPSEMQSIWTSLIKLSWKYPFQAECLMLMMVSGRRNTEILKIKKDMVYYKGNKDNEFDMDNIIVLPATITKNRENSFITITEPVKFVLDQLNELYKRPKLTKYKFIPHMFPSSKFSSKSWLDKDGNISQEFINSRKTRLCTVRDCWELMKDDTGLRNIVPRMLRKTYASMSVKKLKTSAKAKNLTGHRKASTLDIHYDVHNQDEVKGYANEVAETFDFTQRDNT